MTTIARQRAQHALAQIQSLEQRCYRSATLSVVASFNLANGGGPSATPYIDRSGNLFGTAAYGGASGDGVIYELGAGSNTITPVASFDNINNGAGPRSSLIVDSSGNFFGTTADGGIAGNGTIFELNSTSNTLATFANFNGDNGATPMSGLFNEDAGFLYGVTDSDTSGNGVYYSISLDGGMIARIASFDSTTVGANPRGQLFEDVHGNLFGTAAHGAPADDGSVFEIPAGSYSINLVAAFNGSNGMTPQGGVVLSNDGTIYGAARQGGQDGFGVIFKIAPGSNSITPLAQFNNANGAFPESGLLIDGSGNLFGTTSTGGLDNAGTVYELPAGSNTITTIATFNVNNGATPQGNLVADKAGHLFGVAYNGGASGDGVIFEIPDAGFNPISHFATLGGNGVVSITGTAADDSIVVTDTNGLVSVTMNGQTDPAFTDVIGIDVLGGPGNDSISLGTLPMSATVKGGSGNDSIIGTSAADSLRGGRGNDSISGAGGNDTIVGGGGADCLRGGAGNDLLVSGPGNDILLGGEGNDTLHAGADSASVYGNAGNDSLVAGSGSAYLNAGPGSNTIIGSIAYNDYSDTIDASIGSDFIIEGAFDAILGATNNDTVMY